MTITVNVEQSATFIVSNEVLHEKLVSGDGSVLFTLIDSSNTTLVNRADLMMIAVGSTVLPSDYAGFEDAVAKLMEDKNSGGEG